MFPWIDGLLKGQLPDGTAVQSYYQVDGRPLGEKKVWLQDDYVKFIRFGQWRIECSGIGILGYITNNGYLNNPTFRGMRQCLMTTFGRIDVVDLHGNSKKKEVTPDGAKDENVFEIEQGVSVGIMRSHGCTEIKHADLYGGRTAKQEALAGSNISLNRIEPNSPFYFFSPQDESMRYQYERGWGLQTAFPMNTSGIVTARDHFVIDIDRQQLISRLANFSDQRNSDDSIRDRYFAGMGSSKYDQGDSRGWKLPRARAAMHGVQYEKAIVPLLYRPFDTRFFVNLPELVDWSRPEVMSNMLFSSSLGLISARSNKSKNMDHFLASRFITEAKTGESTTQSVLFPLWLYSGEAHRNDLHADDLIRKLPGRSANLSPSFVAALCEAIGLGASDWFADKPTAPLNAEKIFQYLYAVLHSPEYRQRYAGFLRIDFPRIPVPGSRPLFDALSTLGKQLVQWHLLEHPTAVAITATSAPKVLNVPVFFGGDCKLLKVAEKSRELANLEATSAGPTGKVRINATSGFSGVRQAVWQHCIGGYQVLHKWLDDRRKAERSVSDDDIAHWRRVYAALEATQSLMGQVDMVINEHGGWPGAFSQDHPPPDPAILAAQPIAKRARAKRASVGQSSLFGEADEAEGSKPRPKARATPARAKRSVGGTAKAEPDDAATMVAVREVLRVAAEPLARDVLIRNTAHALGFKRTGPRIVAALDDAIRRAVRRGIAVSEKGKFSLLARTIGDFEREILKAQLLACLGRDWVERKDLAPRLARWLGFARTGPIIQATVKSLINSLLRSGDVQKRRDEVHRA